MWTISLSSAVDRSEHSGAVLLWSYLCWWLFLWLWPNIHQEAGKGMRGSFWLTVQWFCPSWGETWGRSVRQLVTFYSQPGNREREYRRSARSFRYLGSRTPAHGMELPTFVLDLPTFINPTWKDPHKQAQGLPLGDSRVCQVGCAYYNPHIIVWFQDDFFRFYSGLWKRPSVHLNLHCIL